jgi:hypothetical protein
MDPNISFYRLLNTFSLKLIFLHPKITFGDEKKRKKNKEKEKRILFKSAITEKYIL